jgi:superoxide dismutase, Cu-Zn family
MGSSRHLATITLALALALAGWACGRGDHAADETANARLFNSYGGEVAEAQLAETEGGVRIHLAVDSLPPGNYTLQIHETGSCEPPDFLSAGEPYPPPEELAMVEGMAAPLPRSVGPFRVTDGAAEVDTVAPVVTLRPGDNSLFHPGGTSLIIDDVSAAGTYKGRVACGLITRVPEHTVQQVPQGDFESARQPRRLGTPGKKYQRPQAKP